MLQGLHVPGIGSSGPFDLKPPTGEAGLSLLRVTKLKLQEYKRLAQGHARFQRKVVSDESRASFWITLVLDFPHQKKNRSPGSPPKIMVLLKSPGSKVLGQLCT